MSDLYEQDFIGWTGQQALALREAGERRSDLPLDWRHLAEEIERNLDDDPGLKPRLAGILRKEAPRATKRAVGALRRSGADAAADNAAAMTGARYAEAQLLGDWLPERPDLP